MRRRAACQRRQAVAHHIGELDALQVEANFASGDAVDLEQVLDHPRDVLRLARNDVARVSRGIVLRADPREDLHGADDGRQRVAELVPQHRHEFVLGAIGGLGRGARRALAHEQRLPIVLDLASRGREPGDAGADGDERDDRRRLVPRRDQRTERRHEPVVERERADDHADDGRAEAGKPGHDHDHEEERRRRQRLDEEAQRDKRRDRGAGRDDGEGIAQHGMLAQALDAHRVVSVKPPSTTSVWPVTQRASALAR